METLSRGDARKKYEDKYIGMVITEQKLNDPNNSMGYVVYIMDTYEETFKIPRNLEGGLFVSTMPGMAVGGIEIGGLYFNG